MEREDRKYLGKFCKYVKLDRTETGCTGEHYFPIRVLFPHVSHLIADIYIFFTEYICVRKEFDERGFNFMINRKEFN